MTSSVSSRRLNDALSLLRKGIGLELIDGSYLPLPQGKNSTDPELCRKFMQCVADISPELNAVSDEVEEQISLLIKDGEAQAVLGNTTINQVLDQFYPFSGRVLRSAEEVKAIDARYLKFYCNHLKIEEQQEYLQKIKDERKDWELKEFLRSLQVMQREGKVVFQQAEADALEKFLADNEEEGNEADNPPLLIFKKLLRAIRDSIWHIESANQALKSICENQDLLMFPTRLSALVTSLDLLQKSLKKARYAREEFDPRQRLEINPESRWSKIKKNKLAFYSLCVFAGAAVVTMLVLSFGTAVLGLAPAAAYAAVIGSVGAGVTGSTVAGGVLTALGVGAAGGVLAAWGIEDIDEAEKYRLRNVRPKKVDFARKFIDSVEVKAEERQDDGSDLIAAKSKGLDFHKSLRSPGRRHGEVGADVSERKGRSLTI